MVAENQACALSIGIAVTTALIGVEMGLSFEQTLFGTVFGGLLVLLISMSAKEVTKVKLYSKIEISKGSDEYFVSVLLWNSAIIKAISAEDFGEKGLVVLFNFVVQIKDVVMNNNKCKPNFIPYQSKTNGNRLEIWIPNRNAIRDKVELGVCSRKW